MLTRAPRTLALTAALTLALSSSLGLGACANGKDGVGSLVRLDDEGAGDNCLAGGVAIRSGADLDGDGTLTDSEITATEYICHGVDGTDATATLISLADEPAGANCIEGGQAILVGGDANADGLLQPEEVSGTSYVCHGATGVGGAPGALSLVRQEDEPPGVTCRFGGRAILSGLDLDGNGYLDDAEVSAVSPVCNGAPGAPGHSTLFDLITLPRGVDCAGGGFRISSGLDLDDDGVLIAGETTQVRHVCHGITGIDGRTSVVEVTALLPGPECTAGGIRIDAGVDLDSDGTIVAAEITTSRYVCDGIDGRDGIQTMVLTTVEPSGTNCTAGGHRLDVGSDDNRDDLLTPDEVDVTSYVCHGGGVVVRIGHAAWGGVCPRGGVRIETGVDDDGDGVLGDAEVDRVEYACNLFLVQLDSGEDHTCALVSNGTVRCWGFNSYGQLGDGTTVSRTSPVAVSGLVDAVSISTGGSHTCARLSFGTVMCWGNNAYGRLGDGTIVNRLTPTEVSGLVDAIDVVAGGEHTCARRTGGTASCWGFNIYGQLGDGTIAHRSSPVTVVGLAAVEELALGQGHTCARALDSSVRCWGNNAYGQLGDATIISRVAPVVVSGLSLATRLTAGANHTCVIRSDSGGRCWGLNTSGQLGDNTVVQRNTAVTITTLALADRIAAGEAHTCVTLVDGTGRCWGANASGQLGDNSVSQRNVPTVVLGLALAVDVSTGMLASCARLQDGAARCWGRNAFGQLGDGSTIDRRTPVPVLFGLAP